MKFSRNNIDLVSLGIFRNHEVPSSKVVWQKYSAMLVARPSERVYKFLVFVLELLLLFRRKPFGACLVLADVTTPLIRVHTALYHTSYIMI